MLGLCTNAFLVGEVATTTRRQYYERSWYKDGGNYYPSVVSRFTVIGAHTPYIRPAGARYIIYHTRQTLYRYPHLEAKANGFGEVYFSEFDGFILEVFPLVDRRPTTLLCSKSRCVIDWVRA